MHFIWLVCKFRANLSQMPNKIKIIKIHIFNSISDLNLSLIYFHDSAVHLNESALTICIIASNYCMPFCILSNIFLKVNAAFYCHVILKHVNKSYVCVCLVKKK